MLKMSCFNPFKKFFLCSKHFDNEQYFNSGRKRLRPNIAIPSIFDHVPLEDIQVADLFSSIHPDLIYGKDIYEVKLSTNLQ